MPEANTTSKQTEFSFLKGNDDVIAPKNDSQFDWNQSTLMVRQHLNEAMNARNVVFLLGSGCSSLRINGKEVGIPTMKPMAKNFVDTEGEKDDKFYLTGAEYDSLKSELGIDITEPEYANNLERLMEVLFNFDFVLQRSSLKNVHAMQSAVQSAIKKLKWYILHTCNTEFTTDGNTEILKLYESFYRKLVYRDRSLPRPWVFTTNYDLFNETAMDRLGIPYSNGFSGVVERRFNPSTFNFALAEQLDILSAKWSAVDNFIYLCKLHGSVNWIEQEHGLFPIRELQNIPSDDVNRVLIFPTPLKQNASLASPYSDLFREFHLRNCRKQTVLFVLGYGFGDEHINNIIFQALTIPTFRLIIFAAPESKGNIAELRALDDPRIWIIGGDGPRENEKAHHFKTVIREFMPQPPNNRVEKAIEEVLRKLISTNTSTGEGDENNEF